MERKSGATQHTHFMTTRQANPIATPDTNPIVTRDTNLLVTRFTQEYKVKFPFASAGMAFFGTAELAKAVCLAGGIGAIGAGPLPAEAVRSMIQEVKKATPQPFNVNFITGMSDEKKVQVCIEEQVPIVSFHWGHPSKTTIERLHQANIKVWEQVGSVEDAKRAAGEGIDLIIAQGMEAGGHNYSTLPTFVLVPEIVAAVGPTLVLASGGISLGRQVAAALCLGADGVWIGTRLVASEEAFADAEYKARLLRAKGTDTCLSSIFGPEMPDFNPMRVLENELIREFAGKEDLLPATTANEPVIGKALFFGKEIPLKRFTNFLPIPGTEANLESMPLLAGQGVGLIHEIKPAAKIINEMMKEASRTLSSFATS
jgi:NAD(P)H-dependent flavin oxidoreductase YrpB (nitropropane dioxygenase family)